MTSPTQNPGVPNPGSSDPDEIRRNIDTTRQNLSSDVQALADKVSPSQIVHRQTAAAKGALAGVRDKVMGAASDLSSHAAGAGGSAASSVSGAASSATESVAGAPAAIQARAQGNPLAAGLIAFGVGWLASSLLPASAVEQKLATQAKEHAGPLMDQLSAAGTELKDNLTGPAQDAAASIKDAAAGAAATVADEGRSAASEVTEQAKQSKDDVQAAG